MKKPKIYAYNSSDYAGVENAKFKFYFGYEETVSKRVGFREDDEDTEWAFVARTRKGKEIIRIGARELEKACGQDIENAAHGLTVGMGLFVMHLPVTIE